MQKPIVVPYDGSAFSRRAFPWGLELARRTAASLHVVRAHVFSVPAMEPQITPPYEPDFLTVLVNYERADLERIAAELTREGVATRSELLEVGRPVALLSGYIAGHNAGWVVMTTHGRGGFNRMWLGSVTTGLIHECHAPIILLPKMAKDDAVPSVNHIAVALDGSELAEAILEPVAELARIFGARLTLMEIVSAARVAESFYGIAPLAASDDWTKAAEAQAEMSLNRVADRVRSDTLQVDTYVRSAWENTAETILLAAQEVGADMVALSTHGRGFWSRTVIGSVADKVLRMSELPLLVWHPPEDES